ncbi:MAG: PD40 domain-containing protein, partial [Anaerolineae bacterium]|nr:PD40 domain-containing protein [Anaerolineae bacterium]
VYLTLARGDAETGDVAAEPTSTAEPTAVYIVPSEPHIAFVSDMEGDVAIYVMDTDGSDRQRVSGPDQGLYFNPSWSPDGQLVAYVGGEGDVPDNGVWVAASDGAEHIHVSHAISNVFGIRPTWSPSGTLLAFVAGGEQAEEDGPGSTIHIAQADGGGITRSIPLPWMAHDLTWSPTGGVLLLVGDISDDDESSVQMLSIGEHNGDEEITEMFRGALTADWSPDGEEVVVGDYTSNTILVVGRDQEPRTVAQLTLQPVAVSWSPDGVYVAVTTAGHHRTGYGDALYLVALETDEVTTVVENEGWVVLSNWSPDGSRLLFTMGPLRQRPGVDLPYADLWLYDVASGELEQLTFSEGFEGMGIWSP